MLISCLMPVYNRYPFESKLVEEALESFIRQDYIAKELIICNDTPGQEIHYQGPGNIQILNLNTRFTNLSDKIQYMIDHAKGEAFCRWDDDDISLPHRLSLSIKKLMLQPGQEEWRCENHFYDENHVIRKITEHPGNTHVHSIFTRRCLKRIQGYPRLTESIGAEDQAFTAALRARGYPHVGELLPPDEVFYLYRWGASPTHLSGYGRDAWSIIGKRQVHRGDFWITPKWHANHSWRVQEFLQRYRTAL